MFFYPANVFFVHFLNRNPIDLFSLVTGIVDLEFVEDRGRNILLLGEAAFGRGVAARLLGGGFLATRHTTVQAEYLVNEYF